MLWLRPTIWGKYPKNLSFVDAAPILCAGVTTYKGLKETNAQPGEWVVISGAGGGLGHVAIQYAKAMGLHVAAVDLGPEKAALARRLGAEIAIDARTQDPPTEIRETNWRGTWSAGHGGVDDSL